MDTGVDTVRTGLRVVLFGASGMIGQHSLGASCCSWLDSYTFEQFPKFFDLIASGLFARMGAMAVPRLPEEADLHTGPASLRHTTAERNHQGLDLREHNGRGSWRRENRLQRLSVSNVHPL